MTGEPRAKGAPHPSTHERAQGQDVLGLGEREPVDLYTATGELEVGVPDGTARLAGGGQLNRPGAQLPRGPRAVRLDRQGPRPQPRR
jgi:hypothetical protein